MATIQSKKLSDQVKGDTWNGLEVTYSDGDGDPIDITGWYIEAEFNYACKTGTNVYSPNTTDGGVTIVDAAEGVFKLDVVNPLDWEIGTYFWTITTTNLDSHRHTYVKGTIKIIEV